MAAPEALFIALGVVVLLVLCSSLLAFSWCCRDAGVAHWYTLVAVQSTWLLVLVLIAVDFVTFAFGHRFLFVSDGLSRLLLLMAWWDARSNFNVLDEWYTPLAMLEESAARSKARMVAVVGADGKAASRNTVLSVRLRRLDKVIAAARRAHSTTPVNNPKRPLVLVVYFSVLAVFLWRTQADEEREAGWLSLASVWIATPTILHDVLSGQERRRQLAVTRSVAKLPPAVKRQHAPHSDSAPCEHCTQETLVQLGEPMRALLWVLWYIASVTIAIVSLKHEPLGWHSVLLLWFSLPKAAPFVINSFLHLRDSRTVRLEAEAEESPPRAPSPREKPALGGLGSRNTVNPLMVKSTARFWAGGRRGNRLPPPASPSKAVGPGERVARMAGSALQAPSSPSQPPEPPPRSRASSRAGGRSRASSRSRRPQAPAEGGGEAVVPAEAPPDAAPVPLPRSASFSARLDPYK